MAYSKRVQAVIDFIEKLTIPSGVGAGGPFKLRKFQKKFINDVYGPHRKNGLRKIRRAILSIGRKNGKTSLIAALVLVHLVGPEQVLNGEIYSYATERDQAAQVFKYCAQMIDLEPELDEILKVVVSTKTIVNYANGTIYRALSSEAGSKMGKNPTFAIYDELAQAKNRDLYDAIDTAFGAREEPLFIVISTQSPDPQHPLSLLIDDGLSGEDDTICVHLYAVDDELYEKRYCEFCKKRLPDADNKAMKCPECEGKLISAIYDPDVWKDANPALGDFRDAEDFRILANRAKRMPSFESAFRNLYLNQRVDAKGSLIPPAEWAGCFDKNSKIDPGEKIYLGLDLSGTTDLCALAAVSAENGDRVAAWFWKPGNRIKEHAKRDRVPYDVWVQKGYIEAPDGNAINYGYIAKKLAKINAKYEVLGLAYDRWRIDLVKKELDAIGVAVWVEGKDDEITGALRMVPWGQGFGDMAPAVDAIEISVLERKLSHNGNPVLTWNVSNAIVMTNPAGDRKLDKSKVRFRIDGMQAVTMGIGLKYREIAKKPKPGLRMPVMV